MWKDYLYLNKREKAAVLTLTIVVVIMQILIWTSGKWMPVIAKSLNIKKDTTGIEQADFMDDRNIYFENDFSKRKARVKNYRNIAEPRIFNPNTADSATLVSVGIRPYVARNIIRYRNKGGKFRKPEDIAKIYGMEENAFRKLLPYIRTGVTEDNKQSVNYASALCMNGSSGNNFANSGGTYVNVARSEFKFQRKDTVKSILSVKGLNKNEGLPAASFELNSADTSSLQIFKGVGRVTAYKIIKYRKQLGGFYNVSQLSEISGINPETIETLKRTMTVNPLLIRKIRINEASLEMLRAHPYIDFYQARVIVGLRKSRNGVRNLNELAEFREFNSDDLEKLKWYVEL